KNVATLGLCEQQRDVEHGHQDLVQHAGRIELPGGLKKKGKLLEVGRFLFNLNDRDLAEEFACGIRSVVCWIEQDVGGVTGAEFKPVAAFELLPLDALAIDVSAVL